MRRLPAIALCVLLVTTAVAKLAFPPPAKTSVGTLGGVVVAILELTLVVGIVRRGWRPVALRGVQVLAGSGIVIALASTADCGCLGSAVDLGPREHVALAAAVGLLASICARADPAGHGCGAVQSRRAASEPILRDGPLA
ncbi:MAG: hypothetical protein KDE27_31770 [Planctomycetes bacterium]|nr:hypothetical protein [Planctomycetota bacterium]